MDNLSENYQMVQEELRKFQNLGSIFLGLNNIGIKFLIMNLIFMASISLVLINQMIQGYTFLSILFLVSTIFFAVLISLSSILLLLVFINNVGSQAKISTITFLKDDEIKYQSDILVEELKSNFIKVRSYIKSSILISAISTFLYFFIVIAIYFSIL